MLLDLTARSKVSCSCSSLDYKRGLADGPQLCALGKMSVLGSLGTIRNNDAVRVTGSGGGGPMLPRHPLKVSTIQ